MKTGYIYLVGAGPGDPGLITVRGMQVLAEADVVVYDYLASPRLLAHAPPEAERIYVGKKAAAHTLSQAEISALLVEKARQGAIVVRLKGGDPYVFGRGGEEALAAVDAGIGFEVVPGVTAGVAACAYAGIPVTHRQLASSLGLVTGHETPDKADSDLDYAALAKWKGTLAFYMGVANLPTICKNLVAGGLSDKTPAALIRRGTTSRQEVLVGTVATLPEAAREADFKPPAIIVIGEVVRLRDKLNWFEKRPLFGRRIVVTRAHTQASKVSARLEGLGAEVVEMPAIRILPPEDPAPLHRAASEVAGFDWVVFTSVNGVDAFFAARDEEGKDSRSLGLVKVCSIGPATSERLSHHGIRPDAQPAKYVGAEVAGAMAATGDLSGQNGQKVLCPRADIAPPDLIDELASCGAVVHEVVAYRTAADRNECEALVEMLEGDEINWITFASSSTVRNFFAVIDPDKVRGSSAHLASIGPVTSATLLELGFEPTVEAELHTIDGLVDAILEYVRTPGESS